MLAQKRILLIVLVVLSAYIVLQGLLTFISNKAGITAHCAEIETVIADNQSEWQALFSSDFDQAVACRTEGCTETVLNESARLLRNTDKARFFQTSYFVRLNTDGNIEKWFQSGEVVTTIPTTNGEKKVVRLLEGKSGPICAQNWKVDAGLTFMTYLHDGYSEAETIIPVTSGKDVLGAIVSRFGD